MFKSSLRLLLSSAFPGLYRRIRHARRAHISQIIERTLWNKEEVVFVQIGSNDGRTGDPLFELIQDNVKWRGLLVEPVPYLYGKLCENYGNDSRFIFENVAIAEVIGKVPFYYVSPDAKQALKEQWRDWYSQLGSFNKEHILNTEAGEFLRDFIIEQPVDSLPLTDLLARHKLDKVDVIHIDTEGFDLKVLSQVDLKGNRPKVILVEHKHLADTDRAAMRHLLESNGYRIEETVSDYLGIR